jgi:folate-dependent phosphoribosylglycinamide formyltransferase PurN
MNLILEKYLEDVLKKSKKGDTIDTLYERLKKKENALYVKVLKELCKNGNKFDIKTITII